MPYMLPRESEWRAAFDKIVKYFTLYRGTGISPGRCALRGASGLRSASRASVGDPPFGADKSVAERTDQCRLRALSQPAMSQIFPRSANALARIESRRRPEPRARRRLARLHPDAVVLGHQAERVRRAADPVQPRPPRRRRRPRLPLLPYVGREIVVRRHSADQDLHELPLADLDERADPRAGAGKLPK